MAEGKLSVGNVDILGITDHEVHFPKPLTEVSLESWALYQQRFEGHFAGPDTWCPHFGGMVVRSEGRTILVDTVLGSNATNAGAMGMFAAGADGHMMVALEAAGGRRDDIDTVFFTHLHPDHVGWDLTRERRS